MSSYQVIVTEAAEGEIDSALEYLLLRSPDAARDFQDGMDKAILSLSEMPRRCQLAPEDWDHHPALAPVDLSPWPDGPPYPLHHL